MREPSEPDVRGGLVVDLSADAGDVVTFEEILTRVSGTEESRVGYRMPEPRVDH